MPGLLFVVTGLKKVKLLAQSRGVEVFFSGMVQGVGFRFSARNLATKHRIKGWVMNLSDGRVKLLAEGSGGDLDNFLYDLRDEFKRYIGDCMFQEKEASGDYEDFQIKFLSS